MTDATEPNLQ